MVRTSAVAKRELLYSLKGETKRYAFCVSVGLPYFLDSETVNFKFDPGAAGCTIAFDGLGEPSVDVYGIDLLHALQMAADIDRWLRGMDSKYDFYWSSGEPYF